MNYFRLLVALLLINSMSINAQEIPTKVIQIYTYPNEATVLINGKEVGTTPLKYEIEMFSTYLIRVKKDGYYSDSKKIGKGYKKNKLIFTLVSKNNNPKVEFVQGGGFFRGDDLSIDSDSRPAKLISISSFIITETEITNLQFCEFLTAIGCNRKGEFKGAQLINLKAANCEITYDAGKFMTESNDTSHPVSNVTWYGANEYCEWLGGRLPTEAEWEFASGGGINTNNYKYSGSNNPEEVAWYNENSDGSVHNVGELDPNEVGLYDMSGNVMEWVNDYYRKGYYSSSMDATNPKGPNNSKYKVARGGAWNRGSNLLKIKKRYPLYPSYSNENLGFRCVFQLKQ